MLSGLGLDELVPRFDELLHSASPHYQYGESDANGLMIMDVAGADAVEVEFILVGGLEAAEYDAGLVEKRRFRWSRGKQLTSL